MEELKSAILEKCVDGDTASFKVDGEIQKYRFLAIDTPESVHPTKKEQEYGKTASEYTCQILTNAKNIEIESEAKNKTDKYGRNLAWIWVDDELLQKILVEEGYAQVAYIYGDYKYTMSLCAIQQTAKEKKLNIWSNKKYEEGYCKTVDLTGIEPIITKPEAVVVKEQASNSWLYYVIAFILVLFIIFDKKTRNKVINKTRKKVEKELLK